ncbi:NAD(P)H-quinone oxidoreductase subunit L [Pyrus ussuriensis x Pyrus communis]|uniref:NAD(P)H-quinone oxidoreductase subunit L n=1 Tax=Pyrus ussuriensis x Pyrus communis TaxID=2448454 RepID=A0A5N5H1S7_9ROSA|nr:NAD(P)H-quinone oxidoreductase subunit L [Pyrus ussuriensis x Pyrus communis]
MSCSFSFQIPPALPSLSRSRRSSSLPFNSQHRHTINVKPEKIEQPAFAVIGINYEEDLTWSGVVAFRYFLVMPPIIMYWLRIRWYKRNLLEMYFQFMFVFLFFPGVLLWAPFLNFRKFPRDPSMKYPWSKPDDPDQIKAGFLKYPFAEPEEYS